MTLMQLCLSRSWGGLEMSALRFAEILTPRGHTSICVALDDSPLAAHSAKAGIHTETLKRPAKLWPFGASLRLRRMIKTHQVELIFVHHLKDLTILVPALIGLKHVKAIGLSHMLLKNSKKDFFHRFLYSFLSRMIVFTGTQKHLSLPVMPVQENSYAVIPGFVDTSTFHPEKRNLDLRRSWSASDDDIVFGTIGRLDEQKGQAEFLKALSIVRAQAPELKWKAVLIGAVTAGEELKGYASYVQSLLVDLKLEDRVKILGFLPDPSSAMASLDIFVLPSYKETFGLVILEAMASGVVPVVTDAGGPPDIVGDTGLKVLPKDPDSLAQALVSLLRHPELRSQLAEKSLARAKSVFSRETVGTQLDHLVRETLS